MNNPGAITNLKYGAITESVLGCAFEVVNELGTGFLESVYGNAMLIALRQRGLTVVPQHPCAVNFRGECVGNFYADILVAGNVMAELKAVKSLAPEHQAQVINYLNATGIEVGLLINFGNQKLEYRRVTRSKDYQPARLNIDAQHAPDENEPRNARAN